MGKRVLVLEAVTRVWRINVTRFHGAMRGGGGTKVLRNCAYIVYRIVIYVGVYVPCEP